MAPIYRVAVIQLQCKVPSTFNLSSQRNMKSSAYNHFQPLQAAKNFTRAEEYIRSAAKQNCHLVVLPEFHLTNWLPAEPKFAAACADWETYVRKYQALAKELKICIVPGSIVRPRTPTNEQPQGLDNVCYFISNDGSILGCYQKKSLWGDEKKWLASGHGLVNKVIDVCFLLFSTMTAASSAYLSTTIDTCRESRPPHLLGPRLPRVLAGAGCPRRKNDHCAHSLDPQRRIGQGSCLESICRESVC